MVFCQDKPGKNSSADFLHLPLKLEPHLHYMRKTELTGSDEH